MNYLKIVDWSIINAFTAEPPKVDDKHLRLKGIINDLKVVTSEVLSYNQAEKLLHCVNSSYKLGKMSPEFRLYLRNNNFELGDLCLRKK